MAHLVQRKKQRLVKGLFRIHTGVKYTLSSLNICLIMDFILKSVQFVLSVSVQGEQKTPQVKGLFGCVNINKLRQLAFIRAWERISVWTVWVLHQSPQLCFGTKLHGNRIL